MPCFFSQLKMPILFDLPTDVSLSILMDWLGDIKSLMALDSASARSVRGAYLELVRDPVYVLMEELSFEESPTIRAIGLASVGSRSARSKRMQQL